MPKPKSESCANCLYFADGQCLRYPPTMFDHDLNRTAQYPKVDITTWCGEWKVAK